ncbi:conserved hypothetical protein [Massilia sp. 9I]|nr:conserved hypothetical protein [Massilia sp. 9I]
MHKSNRPHSSTASFWDTVTSVPTTSNEAAVELQIVMPLLFALGFGIDDIAAKVPVALKEGTKRGRPFEADFVAYSAALHDRDTSLLVVEAKAPGESLDEARKQGESYALALRAPGLLVTDGVHLQVWQLQPTLENTLVFESPLSVIKDKRGELEQLIGKQALIAHSASLLHKKLAPSPDFWAYESAEMRRAQGSSTAISRVLLAESGERVHSANLLPNYPQGAVITAPSGYGKSTLATVLLREGIEQRWHASELPLPVDVPLVDLHESNDSLIDFVHARIAAHLPQLTVSAIQDIARRQGLLLICDGYDRTEQAGRPFLEAQLRQIGRDYPKSRLFVFSRGSVAPHLPLPRLKLQSLDPAERRSMATAMAGVDFPLSLMPRLLVDLCEIPLVLGRVIAFWLANRRFPNRLDELFEYWVQQFTVDPSLPPTQIVLRRKILTVLARELGIRSLTPSEALDLTLANGAGHQIFDALVECGALVMSTTSVELVHEGLADHLRARTLAALPHDELYSALAAIDVDEESLMPVLLIALLEDPDSRAHIWKRLREMSLPRYIDAIRFSGIEDDLYSRYSHEVVEQRLAEEMADSIESLVDAFFPSISSEIKGSLANRPDPVPGICLVTKISLEPDACLVYSLQPSSANTIRIERPSSDMTRHYISLAADQIGAHSGRYLGAIAVRNGLNEVVQHRRFRGGILLANERTIGRLRFLHEAYQFPTDPAEPLNMLLDRLQEIKHMREAGGAFGSSAPSFTIMSMIEDVELLLASGFDRLDWWWLQYGMLTDMTANSRNIERYLQEHYRRMTALYFEIVIASFERVSKQFSLFQVAPVRWDLVVTPSSYSDLPTEYWRWLPVANETDAGTDVTFYDSEPLEHIREEEHDSLLELELRRLGRSANHYSISGSRSIPDPGSRDWRGQLTGETSAMRAAVRFIEDDVKFLFRDLPARIPSLWC